MNNFKKVYRLKEEIKELKKMLWDKNDRFNRLTEVESAVRKDYNELLDEASTIKDINKELYRQLNNQKINEKIIEELRKENEKNKAKQNHIDYLNATIKKIDRSNAEMFTALENQTVIKEKINKVEKENKELKETINERKKEKSVLSEENSIFEDLSNLMLIHNIKAIKPMMKGAIMKPHYFTGWIIESNDYEK